MRTVCVTGVQVSALPLSGPVTFCQGGSVTLDAGAGFSSYLWSNGDTTRTITVATNGTFTVRVTRSEERRGGDGAPAAVTVNQLTVAAYRPRGPVTCWHRV